jgi:hypothetical protein
MLSLALTIFALAFLVTGLVNLVQAMNDDAASSPERRAHYADEVCRQIAATLPPHLQAQVPARYWPAPSWLARLAAAVRVWWR